MRNRFALGKAGDLEFSMAPLDTYLFGKSKDACLPEKRR